jgi:hypothetical protein
VADGSGGGRAAYGGGGGGGALVLVGTGGAVAGALVLVETEEAGAFVLAGTGFGLVGTNLGTGGGARLDGLAAKKGDVRVKDLICGAWLRNSLNIGRDAILSRESSVNDPGILKEDS